METENKTAVTRKNNVSKTQRIQCFRDWLRENKMPWAPGSFIIKDPAYKYKRTEGLNNAN